MAKKSYVIEGEWTGYTSSQQRVVHRQVLQLTDQEAKKYKDLRVIVYTDGTSLIVSTREKKPREAVQKNDQYGSLIREAVAHGGSRVLVADLP